MGSNAEGIAQADEEPAHGVLIGSSMQTFKRERVHDRLAELEPDAESAETALRDGLALVLKGCEQYRVLVEEVRAIVLDTPTLNGQHLGHDPRPEEWYVLARDALDSEITRPGLTLAGAARVIQFNG